jgi:hypothetical protein
LTGTASGGSAESIVGGLRPVRTSASITAPWSGVTTQFRFATTLVAAND